MPDSVGTTIPADLETVSTTIKGAREANELLKAKRIQDGGFKGKPVNLNIKGFKRYLSKEFPNLTKSQRNYAIKKYKTEAWSDYDEVVKFKMSEPTRSTKKANGKQGKQTADLPMAGE